MKASSTEKTDRKLLFVVLEDSEDAIFCLDIVDDLDKGVGRIMREIWAFQESYKDPGDEFDISDPYELEGHEDTPSLGIAITYKAACWEKALQTQYFLLDMQYAAKDIMRWAGGRTND